MKEIFFSLNIEEATNDANHAKVLTSLVGHFLPQKSNVVVRLCKVNVLRATSEILFESITKPFEENKLP